MFFCESCATRNDWPQSIFKSYGACEICDTVTECNDDPSRYLPTPTEAKSEYVGKHRKP